MKETRIFLSFKEIEVINDILIEELKNGSLIKVPKNEHHYLTRVLRIPLNTAVLLFNSDYTPNSSAIRLTFTSEGKFFFEDHFTPQDEAQVGVNSISVALCKGDTNDNICEKAVELGCNTINIWNADHSIVRLNSDKKIQNRTERWKKIVASAARQSGCETMPKVSYFNSLEELIGEYNQSKANTSSYFGSLQKNAKQLKQIFPIDTPINIIIGPEGDFSTIELELLHSNGIDGLSLGGRVLRVETAAICAISTINTCWNLK